MIEVEIKLAMPSAEQARARLLAAGAQPVGERAFEDNRVYDDEFARLEPAGQTLRLRCFEQRWTLTFKEGAQSVHVDTRYKGREEFETEVADGAALDQVLNRLGFRVRWRYQKWRQRWALPNVHVELDETPLGTFIELEGAPEAIDAAAGRLGFGAADYVTLSYRELQLRSAGRAAGDLVFSDD